MKYRKKPVEIEAFKYDGDLMGSDGKYYVPDWAVKALENLGMYYDYIDGNPHELFIRTLEGDHHVSVGDYIIQGVKGELYPCKPDIFEMTYENVAPGRVNVRTDWGGARKGAGRPPTGRKKKNYYVTDDEDAKIRELIESLRFMDTK